MVICTWIFQYSNKKKKCLLFHNNYVVIKDYDNKPFHQYKTKCEHLFFFSKWSKIRMTYLVRY